MRVFVIILLLAGAWYGWRYMERTQPAHLYSQETAETLRGMCYNAMAEQIADEGGTGFSIFPVPDTKVDHQERFYEERFELTYRKPDGYSTYKQGVCKIGADEFPEVGVDSLNMDPLRAMVINKESAVLYRKQ